MPIDAGAQVTADLHASCCSVLGQQQCPYLSIWADSGTCRRAVQRAGRPQRGGQPGGFPGRVAVCWARAACAAYPWARDRRRAAAPHGPVRGGVGWLRAGAATGY